MARRDDFVKFIIRSTDTLVEVFCLYLTTILLASLCFMFFENMEFVKAAWLSFVTATSTGYGDIAPKTIGGQATAVVLMHTTIFVMIPLAVARILSVVLEDRNAFTDAEQEEVKNMLRKLTKDDEEV